MKTVPQFIFWLNSMTTMELLTQFPGEFSDPRKQTVTNLLVNDAILWRKVKEYAQEYHETHKPCVIMHQCQPFHNLLFGSIKEARNYIKMTYPKRTWKEPEENILIDKQYGACFKIVTLINKTDEM